MQGSCIYALGQGDCRFLVKMIPGGQESSISANRAIPWFAAFVRHVERSKQSSSAKDSMLAID
jgi:hypothetical protein